MFTKIPKTRSSKLLINDSNKPGNNQELIKFRNQINSLKFTFEDVNKNPKNSIPNPSKLEYPKIPEIEVIKVDKGDNN
jgi:hypothetical protein